MSLLLAPGAHVIATEADAERLFGKWSELTMKTAAMLCETSGHRPKSRWCPVCRRRKAEAARADWFAAEERETR